MRGDGTGVVRRMPESSDMRINSRAMVEPGSSRRSRMWSAHTRQKRFSRRKPELCRRTCLLVL